MFVWSSTWDWQQSEHECTRRVTENCKPRRCSCFRSILHWRWSWISFFFLSESHSVAAVLSWAHTPSAGLERGRGPEEEKHITGRGLFFKFPFWIRSLNFVNKVEINWKLAKNGNTPLGLWAEPFDFKFLTNREISNSQMFYVFLCNHEISTLFSAFQFYFQNVDFKNTKFRLEFQFQIFVLKMLILFMKNFNFILETWRKILRYVFSSCGSNSLP